MSRSTVRVTPTWIADSLGHNLDEILAKAIRERLMAQAKVIVEDVTRDIVKNLRSSVTEFHDMGNDRWNIVLKIDGVKDLEDT